MLNTYRELINQTKIENKLLNKELLQLEDSLKSLGIQLEDLKMVRLAFQKASVQTQVFLEKHVSIIVTNALKAVYPDKDLEFKVKFDKKRNSTSCDLLLYENGVEYDICEDRGGGLQDIVSFALRVAYVLMDNCEKVIIIDEPFRNLSKKRIPYALGMIKQLSVKLKIQFFICTHIPDVADYADSITEIYMENKVSHAKQY